METISPKAGPIGPALLKLSLPVLVGQLFNLIYNLVDTGFIAALDPNDPYLVGATGLVFPLIILMWAVGFGLTSGVSSLVARAIGANRAAELDQTAESGLALAILASVVFLAGIYPLAKPILQVFGASGTTLNYSLSYLLWVLPMVPFLFLNAVFTGILQGEGRTVHMMVGMAIGAVINVILDYVLMFPGGMGIAGAGLATAIGNASTTVYLLIVLIMSQSHVKIHWKRQAISLPVMQEIVRVGLPQSAMNIVMSLSFLFYNRIISEINPVLMSAFTLYSRIEQAAMIPIFALANGLSTMAGQAAGALDFKRFRKAFWSASAMASLAGGVFLTLYALFNLPIFKIFVQNRQVLELASLITPWMAGTSFLAILIIMANTIFAAAGFANRGLILTILRVYAMNIPGAMIGAYLIGKTAEAVVIGLIISSFVALLMTVPVVLRFFDGLEKGRITVRQGIGTKSALVLATEPSSESLDSQ